MKKADVKVGYTYVAKVSGKLARVRIVAEHDTKGWVGRNEATGRQVRILTAARLAEFSLGGRGHSLLTEDEKAERMAAAKAAWPFVEAAMRSARAGMGTRVNASKRGALTALGSAS